MKLIMTKKASADMWWIIIGAVIALVVLIVLIVIFTDKTGAFKSGLSDCEGKGGLCLTSCPANTLKTTAFSCSGEKVCCLGSSRSCAEGCATDEECREGYCYQK